MSVSPRESLSIDGDGRSRRRSLSIFFNQSQSATTTQAENFPKSDEFRVNFHFIKIEGMPTSRFQQYRISVMFKDHKKPVTNTSWRQSNAKGFLIEQTPKTFGATTFSSVVFKVESRFERPSTIGESDAFSIPDLMKEQNTSGYREPVKIQLNLKRKAVPISLELTVRSLPVARELEALSRDRLRDDEGENIARLVHADYPETVSRTVKALDHFVSTNIDSPVHTSCLFASELVHQMRKYMQEHKREKMPYAVEDFAWMFLNELTKEMLRVDQAPRKGAILSSGHIIHTLTSLLRGFWLLCQLHEPNGSNLDTQQQNLIKTELRKIAKSFPYEPKPGTATPSKSSPFLARYPELATLNEAGNNLSWDHLASDASLSHNATFQEITRWLVDADTDHQVFWLHGKFETGETKNQVAATLLQTCKNIQIPVAYYSFAQVCDNRDSEEGAARAMMDNLVYQLSLADASLADASLADALHLAIKETERFHTKSSYMRFQILLHALFSLSYADQLKVHPTLLLIDDLEPSTARLPSTEYNQLLRILSTASRATHLSSAPSSPPASPSPGAPSPASSASSIPESQRSSLPFPPFLRIIVFSRSLGSSPSLIEQFAHIRDSHRLTGPRTNDQAAKLYNSAVDRGNKGKGKVRAQSPERAPLNPIAEADSQGGGMLAYGIDA